MPLNAGEVINNRYRIVKLLGQGGFGAVYRAWDMNLQKSCAVKENLDTAPDLKSQFMREAMTLANLSHSNLPRVIDHFSLPDRGQYMVMDFVEGENLESMVIRAGPVPVTQAVQWIAQIADALEFLHRQNPPIIHRDVKPANIIITPGGQAMLVDFGLVKIFQENARTAKGAQGITAGFSPPEQYGIGKTDARTDVYALGATLYSILTAKVPAQSVDIMAGAEPAPVLAHLLNPKVPQALSMVLQQAMQLNTTQRFRTVDDFKKALVSAVPTGEMAPTMIPYSQQATFAQSSGTAAYRTEPPPPPSSQPVYPASQPKGGRKGIAILGVGGCVALVVLLIVAAAVFWGLYNYTGALAFLHPATATPTSTPTPVPTHTPTITPTFTPSPTPVPTFTPVPEIPTPAPLFSDDFSNPGSGWDTTNGSTYVTDYYQGWYRIYVIDANTQVWANPSLNFTDTIIDVDAYKSGGVDDNNFGVICRYQDVDNFYYFLISSDGYYGILRKVNGQSQALGADSLQRTDTIIQGTATNHIVAECIGSTLTLYVNGQFVASQYDTTFSSGDVGLTAGTYSQGGTDILFDNFVVYQP
jgi:serine/threonine protein kinase